MKNTGGGDLMRVLVEGNSPPAAQNDEGVVNENQTLTVTDDSDPNLTGSYDAHLEHSGDLMDTSSSTHKDSDPNTTEYGDTFTVTAIKVQFRFRRFNNSALGAHTIAWLKCYRHLWNFNYRCGWKLSIYCRSSMLRML